MIDRSYSSSKTREKNIIKEIPNEYSTHFEITIVYVCGIDAIEYNGKMFLHNIHW